MDELRNAMHAAVAEPPPTRIDLDRLIDGTKRRTRLQYVAGIAAGAVAVVAGAVAVPLMAPAGGHGLGEGGPPGPCPQITPTTTARPDRLAEPVLPSDEPCGTVEHRLAEALVASLHTELPGWTFKNLDDPARPVALLRQAVDASPDGYLANVTIRKGSEYHMIIVQVSAHPPLIRNQACRRLPLPGETCTVQPDGEVVATEVLHNLGASSDMSNEGYRVTDWRVDGTTVEVVGSDALTRDRLTRIARTPGLTLFP
jgi:hypothetical protein